MALSSGMALSSHSRSMGSCWTPWVCGPLQRSVQFLWTHLPQTQLGRISTYPVEHIRLCSLGYFLRGGWVTGEDESKGQHGYATRLQAGRAIILSWGDGYLPCSVSLMPPMAFCTLPFTWSALPSDSILESPNALPATFFTLPLACSAEPLMRSLSMSASICRHLSQRRQETRVPYWEPRQT